MKFINVKKDDSIFYNSKHLDVIPNHRYLVKIRLASRLNKLGASYLCAIIRDEQKEISRFIKWIKESSEDDKDYEYENYELNFQTPENSKKISIGYRINFETPIKSNVKIMITDPLEFDIQETKINENVFDDLRKYEVPKLPPLTEVEENELEKKIVWIFGAPRSGTTWLGTRLLNHHENIIWDEPWLGYHLAALVNPSEAKKMKLDELDKKTHEFTRLFDVHRMNGDYFFSPHHKKNWLPFLRKMILARIYSKAQTLTKNIIIKDPTGAIGADIIMEAVPKSKLIFLLRDGRDVVESRIDMHGQDSWAELPPIKIEERGSFIRMYSEIWNFVNECIEKAYDSHDEQYRFFVKYEDLKKDTFGILKKLYQFVGIKIHDSEIRNIVELYDFKNIPDSEKGPGKFNRAATTGGWKKSFRDDEREYMSQIMEKMLKKYGYDKKFSLDKLFTLKRN